MADKLHGAMTHADRYTAPGVQEYPTEGRGNHSIEGFTPWADEAERLAMVQIAEDRGRVGLQLDTDEYYIALGATGQFRRLGDALEMAPSATLHTTNFTATRDVLERWSLAHTIVATLPDGAGLPNGARFGFAGKANSGSGGKLTVTCDGGKTFGGFTASLVFPADSPQPAAMPIVFQWSTADDFWIVCNEYLFGIIASQALLGSTNKVLVTKQALGGSRLDLLTLTEDTFPGVKSGSADVVAVPFSDFLRKTEASLALRIDDALGDDSNDGVTEPLQTATRAWAMTRELIDSGHTVSWTFESVRVAGPYAVPHLAFLARGTGMLVIDALPSTYVTVSSHTIASRVANAIGYELTVAGTPWVADAFVGCTHYCKLTSGALSGQIVPIYRNTDGVIGISDPGAMPAVAVTFDIVQCGVLLEAEGVASEWHVRMAPADPTFYRPSLAMRGVLMTTPTLLESGGLLCPMGGFSGGLTLMSGAYVSAEDASIQVFGGLHDNGGMHCAWLITSPGSTVWRGLYGLAAGDSIYVDEGSLISATHIGLPDGAFILMEGGRLESIGIFNRGAGGIEVSAGDLRLGDMPWNGPSAGSPEIDIQTTGAKALTIRGGKAQISQTNFSTATETPIIRRLLTGTSIEVTGGELVCDPGRFMQSFGRGVGEADIIVGTLHSNGTVTAEHTVDATYFADGSNHTRRARLIGSAGRVVTVGSEVSDHQERDTTPMLTAETVTTSTMLARVFDATTGLARKITLSNLLSKLFQALDANGFGIVNLTRGLMNLETITSASNVLTLNYATNIDKVCTLSENVTTVSVSNEPASGKSQVLKVMIIGASTYTLPASWSDVDWWIPGSAPSAPAAGKRLLVTLWCLNVGGTVHCVGNYSVQP